jgi:hypothetical protein
MKPGTPINKDTILADMLSRVPQYHRAKRVMQAYIDHLQSGSLFTWAPPVDGEYPSLAAPVEKRCCEAVCRELRKCMREIDKHLSGLNEIQSVR